MPAVQDRPSKVKQLKEVIQDHTEALLRQMESGRSDHLVQYLECCARFHEYSFRNILLALWQRPNCTRLAGLHRWNQLGRRIRKGEKGIAILAPVFEKEETGTPDQRSVEERTLRGFRVVYVFDESQTEGDPLPDIIHASGDPGDLFHRLAAHIQSVGIAVEIAPFVPESPTARGVSFGGRIVLRQDLTPANAFRTLVHEYAHEKLHHSGDEKEAKVIRETEADATAFVVCRHYGIECDSSDYLLLYDSTPEILLSRLERVRRTACAIIEAVEGIREETIVL